MSRVEDAVAALPAFSSPNKALWFGFGIKHVIRKLLESQEGLNCIAVCAALSEGFGTISSAKIVRECFDGCSPPEQLTPSLRQWINLIEACEGALLTTDFGVKLHELSKLYFRNHGDVSHLRACSNPKAIANALMGIIQVSNGSMDHIEIVGGADCGWIGAFSVWMLDLLVEVRGSSGETLYLSHLPQKEMNKSPQVLILYGESSIIGAQVVKKRFVVPSGQRIISLVHPESYLASGTTSWSMVSLSCGRVPWDSVLQATFGTPMTSLLHGGLAVNCGTALGCAFRIFAGIMTDDKDVSAQFGQSRTGWKYVNSARYGQGFINTIRRQLSEIATSETVMETMQACSTLTYSEAVAKYEQTMCLIAAACNCIACRVGEYAALAKQYADQYESPFVKGEQPFCQAILVEVITELVQLMSTISLEVNLLPMHAGVELLYWHRHSWNRGN